MFVFVYVCVNIYLYLYLYVYNYVYMPLYIYIYLFVCVCVCLSLSLWDCTDGWYTIDIHILHIFTIILTFTPRYPGMQYLHNYSKGITVIHRDLKSSNGK